MKKNFVKHKQMHEHTLTGILEAIHAGCKSKREVQAHTSFSWGNVSQNIGKLSDLQVIVPQQNGVGQIKKVGRQAQTFTFSSTGYLLLGMEIKSYAILSSLVNLAGNELCSYTLSRDITQDNILQSIADCYESTVQKADVSKDKVYGVSFSLSGAAISGDMIWKSSPKVPSIDNFDFSQCRTIFPSQYIRIERSTTALTKAILKQHSICSGNFVFLSIGNGIGMTVQQNGKFLTGSRGLACEIGRIPYAVNEDGKHGAGLSQFLSTSAILQEVEKVLGTEVAGNYTETVAKLNADQRKTIYRYILPLMTHLAVISCNIFDPDYLVIGGKALNPWLAELEQDFETHLKKQTFYSSPKKVVLFRHSDLYSAAYGTTVGLEANVYPAIIEKISRQYFSASSPGRKV